MDQADSRSSRIIIGSVYNTKGKPVAGAEVNCDGKYTHTLFDGTFKFKNLFPSIYTVTVTQKGFQSQKKTIELREKKVARMDFHLPPMEGSGKIHGHVFDTKTGKPIIHGGTMIMVFPSVNKQVHIRPKDGYFEFSNLPPDTYHVWNSILGYEDKFKKVNLKENEEKHVDFLCKRKESIEPPWG